MALVNALLKTKERHTHRQWILNWLEDNYECKKGATICKAAVFTDYAEVCRLQSLKPVTNSLFGKLVKAVFPAIRTCRKGPRSDSRTHYACLHRRRDTISLPRVCPETGELLPPPLNEEGHVIIDSFIPAPSSATSSSMSSSAIPALLYSNTSTEDCTSAASSSPSSPSSLSYDLSPVVEASGALPAAFQFGQPASHHQHHHQSHQHHPQQLHQSHSAQFPSVSAYTGGLHHHHHQFHSEQHAAVHQLYYSPTPSLSSCSSGSAYDDALSEFESMDIAGSAAAELHDSSSLAAQLPLPTAPVCLCASCDGSTNDGQPALDGHQSASLESVEDLLGDLEPLRLLHLDPAMLHHDAAASDHDHHDHHHSVFCYAPQSASTSDCCGGSGGFVPAVPMSSAMMATPPVAPSPPASPPPPLALMSAPGGAGEFGSQQQQNKLRPFLRRTMAKASAQAAEGNPLAEGFMGMINTCQKIIKDRAQKRRRKSIGDALAAAHAAHAHAHIKHEPAHYQHQYHQHAAKKQHTMVLAAATVAGAGDVSSTSTPTIVDANALVPPFVLSLEDLPGGHSSFAFQESVLVFANEYRKMYQAVFDRLVRFEYAILFDVVFSFWNQVKLQPNFALLLDHAGLKKQVLAYDAKVLHTFKDYFLMNPLKMSAQQFGGFLQTIAFHLPFSVERATLPLLPADLSEEKMRQLQTFAADLQGQAQSLTLPQASAVASSYPPQQQPSMTVMEINNY